MMTTKVVVFHEGALVNFEVVPTLTSMTDELKLAYCHPSLNFYNRERNYERQNRQ